jgi:membrane protein YdbS with pleckstrin-like domain
MATDARNTNCLSQTPTPSPEAVAPIAPPAALEVLDDGEEIILAVRPSLWMVVLESLPTAAIAGVVAAALLIANPGALNLPHSVGSAIVLACGLVVLLRLVMIFLRWLGRLYILTNRRVLRLGGVATVDVADCALERISDVAVMTGSAERLLGLGSLIFTIDGQLSGELGWTNIARPADIAAEVRHTIRRHHGPHHT